MSSLLTEEPVSAHAIALCVLLHAFVLERVPNVARRQRAEEAAARRAAAGATALAQGANDTVANAAAVATPAKTASSASIVGSPGGGDGSFFASPAAASPSPSSSASTPAPVGFNLGLGLGFGDTPARPVAIDPSLAAADGLEAAASDVAAALAAEQRRRARERNERFPQRCYVQLGLFLHAATQNGCVHDPAALARALGVTAPAPLSSSSFPSSLPRFPHLSELRASLLQLLPAEDGFGAAVEAHLVAGLQSLRAPEEVAQLLDSLGGLLVSYSHRTAQPDAHMASPTLRQLDRSSALGCFLREVLLSARSGLFDALVGLTESLRAYKRAGGLSVDDEDEVKEEEPVVIMQGEDAMPARRHARADSSGAVEELDADMDIGVASSTFSLARPLRPLSPAAIERQLLREQDALLASVDADARRHAAASQAPSSLSRPLLPEAGGEDEADDDDADWLHASADNKNEGDEDDDGEDDAADEDGWVDPWQLQYFRHDDDDEVQEVASPLTTNTNTNGGGRGRRSSSSRRAKRRLLNPFADPTAKDVALLEDQSAAAAIAASSSDDSFLGSPPASVLQPFVLSLARSLPSWAGRAPLGALGSLARRLAASSAATAASASDLVGGSSGSGGGHFSALVFHWCFQAACAERRLLEGLDACHRAFDYLVAEAARAAEEAEQARAEEEELLSGKPQQQHGRKKPALTQQYSSLALAQLHAHFGHYSAALMSLRETVRLAQQHKDERCLRLALALLHGIIETKGGGRDGSSNGGGGGVGAALGGTSAGSSGGSGSSTATLLQRCLMTQANAQARLALHASRAVPGAPLQPGQSAPMPELDAMTALALARFFAAAPSELQQLHSASRSQASSSSAAVVSSAVVGGGPTGHPAAVWKSLQRVECLAWMDRSMNPNSGDDGGGPAVTMGGQGGGLHSHAASAALVRAMAWMLYGQPFLSHLAAARLLSPLSSVTDGAIVAAADDGSFAASINADGSASGVSSMDQLHAAVLLASNPSACLTTEARLELLAQAQARFPYPAAHAGMQEPLLHARFDLLLQLGDLDAAALVCTQLDAVSPPKHHSFVRWAESCFASLRLQHARGGGGGPTPTTELLLLRVQNLAEECRERGEHVLALRVLAFLPDLLSTLAACSGAVGEEGAALLHVGLAPLLSAVSLARSLRSEAVLARLLLHVAALQLRLGMLDAAETHLGLVEPVLLAHSFPSPAIISDSAVSTHASSTDAAVGALLSQLHLLQAQVALARLDSVDEGANEMVDDDAGTSVCRRAQWTHVLQLLQRALDDAIGAGGGVVATVGGAARQASLYYLLARVYNELDQPEERNACAERFCELRCSA